MSNQFAQAGDVDAKFATPSETIAGTSTTTIVNPAGLTAKLANQPAAGTCTDREDVVWNGAILQGAAKHYSFSGSFPNIYIPIPATASVPSGVLGARSATITNPSTCRVLRVKFDSSSGASASNLQTTVGANIFSEISVAGTQYLSNLGNELSPNFPTTNIGGSGVFGVGYLVNNTIDVAPGNTITVDYSVHLSGTNLNFGNSGQIRGFFNFSAQTI
jgi:hypothetical protein